MLRVLTHPRGHPGPLPAAGPVEPLLIAGAHGLQQRHVRRGLGRLRDAGDDGPRLRRRRPRAAAEPLEDVPARSHQRGARRGDTHGQHERGRGDGADGRAAAGRKKTKPRPSGCARGSTLDAAVDLLRGLLEMWDLEVAVRRRAAVAAGARADDVPAQRIAGGFGDTPGFDQRAHLEVGHQRGHAGHQMAPADAPG